MKWTTTFVCPFIILIWMLTVFACTPRQQSAVMERADSLMDTRPDSALTLLNTLLPDTNAMSKRDLMRFHLLHTNAENKCDTVLTARGAYGGYTAANENGENFWWGGTVREGKSPWSLNPNGPVVVRFKNVHGFQSIGQNDCVPQTLAEDYRAIYGKSEKTPSYFADDLGYDPKSGPPFSDGTFKNYFSDDMIHTVNNMELIFNEAFVREAAKRNNAINIYWKAEKGDMDHLDVVRKVKFYKNRSKYYVRNYLFNSNNHSYRSINNIFGSFKPVVIYRIGK